MSGFNGAFRNLAVGLGLAGYAVKKRGQTGAWPSLRERNGKVAGLAERSGGLRMLLHGVSVGEVDALEPLARALAQSLQRPDIVLSASTETGVARARDLYAGLAPVVRFPIDFTWTARRFLDAVEPSLVLLGELELWPSFMEECRRRQVPVAVVNGRLSRRSFRMYRRGRRFVHDMFGQLAMASVQTRLYRDRFVALGAPPKRVVVGGSLKWDAARRAPDPEAAEALARDLGIDRNRPLVVAGSTGPGEEKAIIRARPPGCQLLLAPRNQDRWGKVAALAPGMIRRSRTGGDCRTRGGSARDPRPRVFLLDTIGELPLAYSLANVVFVGRSLGPMGGSNPLEPVALGKPTTTGPYHENFRDIVSQLVGGGGLVVSRNPMSVAADWLADPDAAARVGRAGRRVLEQNLGTAQRCARAVLQLVRNEPRPAAVSPPGHGSA